MIRNSKLRDGAACPSSWPRWTRRMRWQPQMHLQLRLYANDSRGNIPSIASLGGSIAERQREAILKRFGKSQPAPAMQPPSPPPPRPPPGQQPQQTWPSQRQPPPQNFARPRPAGGASNGWIPPPPRQDRQDFIPRDRNAPRSFQPRDGLSYPRGNSNFNGGLQKSLDGSRRNNFKSLDGSMPSDFGSSFEPRKSSARNLDSVSWPSGHKSLDGSGPSDFGSSFEPRRNGARNSDSFYEPSRNGRGRNNDFRPAGEGRDRRAMQDMLSTPQWNQLTKKPRLDPEPRDSRGSVNWESRDNVWYELDRQQSPFTPIDVPSDSIDVLTAHMPTREAFKGPDYWDDITGDMEEKKAGKAQARQAVEARRKEQEKLRAIETEVEVDGMKIMFGDDGARTTPKPSTTKTKQFIDRDAQAQARNSKRKKAKKSGGARRSREQDEDDDEWDEDEAAARRRWQREKQLRKEKKVKEAPKINIPQYINVSNLAAGIHVKARELLVQMADWGFENITEDSIMTGETAALVAQEYGFDVAVDAGDQTDLKARPPPKDPSKLPERPPVVTIMGHVDHGKTTILDYLRKSSIALQEHGGITQHIGAFTVTLSSGKEITFLDTPGHAAFLTMRQRGANVTDIVVLVVAADDSVMPQTLEALRHARAAKVPIIVAINKIDMPQANTQRVKDDLGKEGIDFEEYGGETQAVAVSGLTGEGMPDLEENIMLLAEVLDLRGDRTGMVEGWVLESTLKDVGKVATVLVKRGTLKVGDIIVAGKTMAKVRALRNEAGKGIEEATPGQPVEVLGWRESPEAGDEVIQAPDERTAGMAINYRRDLDTRGEESAEAVRQRQVREERQREREAEEAARLAAEEAGEKPESPEERRRRERIEEEEAAAQGTKLVNFIVRADVAGSVEAVAASIQEIGNNEVQPRLLRQDVGPPTLSDVDHASVSQSTIVSFNNEIPGTVRAAAARARVNILDYNIIYRLQDSVKEVVEARLPPRITQKVLAEADVLQIFNINIIRRKYRNVAGSKVTNGTIHVGKRARVMRQGEKIYDGKIDTLKHLKKEVDEIKKGQECGIMLDNFEDIMVGDVIQVYEEVSEKRYL